MLGIFKDLFSSGKETDWKALLAQGAQIVDVRTPEEFRGGCVRGSVNIPLSDLRRRMGELRKDRPVIACCASGSRSQSAAIFLRQSGFAEVHNGGGWRSLQDRI